MRNTHVIDQEDLAYTTDALTELVRTGPKRLIYQAANQELEGFLSPYERRRTADGNAGVVRNGYLPERTIQTGVRPVTVKIPKVRYKTGEPVTFRSELVPPYVRKTRSF